MGFFDRIRTESQRVQRGMRYVTDYFYLFGSGGPLIWLFQSEAFQFLVYGILSYPFAWAVRDAGDYSKKDRLKWVYFLGCWILPLISLAAEMDFQNSHSWDLDFWIFTVLAKLVAVFLWVFRLWLLMILQVLIRNLGDRWGDWGTVLSGIACGGLLYGMLKFCLESILLVWY